MKHLHITHQESPHDQAFWKGVQRINESLRGRTEGVVTIDGHSLLVRRCAGMGAYGRFFEVEGWPFDVSPTLYNKIWFASIGLAGQEEIGWADRMYAQYRKANAKYLWKLWEGDRYFHRASRHTLAMAPRTSEAIRNILDAIVTNKSISSVRISVRAGEGFEQQPLYAVYCEEQIRFMAEIARDIK